MNIETNVNEPQEHLFADHNIYSYEYATTGQRFLNWLIDNIVMRFGLAWLTGYIVGYFLAKFFPNFYLNMVYQKGLEYYLTIYLIAFLNYIIYYSFCEKTFNGYTLGKLVTGTRTLREDGTELTWKDAFLRSVSRLVPLEAFSIWFGTGLWHDTWTKTMVIKTR
jgi:uncharacterized RDD family membrane protein YckC